MTDIRDRRHAQPFTDIADYHTAVATVLHAADQYYNSDGLTMDDATYDELVARIEASEAAHPHWAASTVGDVAAGIGTRGTITHPEPMLSLDKAHHLDEVSTWLERMGDTPSVRVEVKLDGVALAVRYRNGHLDQIVTRGDGHHGEDITLNMRTDIIVGLPRTVTTSEPFEVRGECFLTVDQFTAANTQRRHDHKPAFVNLRNATAGLIRNQHRTQPATISFAAYSLHGIDAASYDHHLTWLHDHGFTTAYQLTPGHTLTTIDQLNHIATRRSHLGFDIDGAVLKLTDLDHRRRLGSTGHHPRWALAFKYPAEERTTVVTGIDVTPGRTGALVPRAVLQPVHVAGTTITYATLHNFDIVAELDVRVGDTVLVKRAGDVIPRIEGVLLDQRPSDSVPYIPPTVCPRCGAAIDRADKRWRCQRGRLCGTVEALTYAASRDALDIDGLGPLLIERLVDRQLVTDLADVFTLRYDDLVTLDGIGDVTATRLIAAIDQARRQPLHRLITALGIRGTGRRISQRLAHHFHTLEAVRAATVDTLATVDGIGPTKAALVFDELRELDPLINRLIGLGVTTTEPDTAPVQHLQPWTGKKVVVTGTLTGLTRADAHRYVELLGASVASSVSAATDLVVAGRAAGSKLVTARQLDIPIVDDTEFRTLIAELAS